MLHTPHTPTPGRFVALYSHAGTDATTGTSRSTTIEPSVSSDVSNRFTRDTESTEWAQKCVGSCNAAESHLLSPGQTHVFPLEEVPSEQALHLDACITLADGTCDTAAADLLQLRLSACTGIACAAPGADTLSWAVPDEADGLAWPTQGRCADTQDSPMI